MWATRSLAAAGVLAGLALAADFDWSAIEPSEQLKYHPCYDGFQCARLSVPLDWQDTNNTKRVAIAITTLPATVSSDDPSFGGTIILNPGGPGGSGVAFAQKFGRRLQAMTEGKKHYEFLGFDPRGIARTTPRADCFGGSHIFARDSLLLEARGIGGLDASESGLRRALALDQAFGSLCETKDLDDDILAYVSTASVARDIIEITDRAEELRRAEQAVAQDPNQHPLSAGDEEHHDRPTRVLYWGFSYGTILGNTLASMFPGRMGRVVLDGVDDAYDYHKGKWLCNLLDTDKIVDYFYDTCFDGKENCLLWKKGDKSGKDIKGRIDKLISDADNNPISLVQSDGSSNLRVITGNDIRQAFVFGHGRPLYAPLPYGFEYLANVLAHTLRGNYSLISQDVTLPLLQDACSIDNSTKPGPDDAQAAILCGDADFADPDGPYQDGKKQGFEFWKSYIETVKNQSSTFGPFWAGISSACSGWRIRPKWRFAGPWGTPQADPSLKEGVPAAPILFTSSRLDPVTPLYDAYLMSNDHPGSAVLIHETVGHCAAATGWSECFNERIRAYFDDGIVPANGTVCDTTCKPFSKDGYCLPPAEVMAAGGEESFFGFSVDRRSEWSFRPLGLI